MKLLYLASMFLLFACGNTKEVSEKQTDSADNNTSTNYRIVGTVHLSDGCPYYIDAVEKDNKKVKMYPINLEEHMKKEGMRIKFDYDRSRAPQPAGCDAEMVVVLKDVTPLRGK